MSLFNMRNVLGAAAIYAGWRYSQKHGGVKQSINGLLDKVREAAEQKRAREIGAAGGERGRGTGFGPGVGASELGPEAGSELGASVSAPVGSRVEAADIRSSSGSFGTEDYGSTRPPR